MFSPHRHCSDVTSISNTEVLILRLSRLYPQIIFDSALLLIVSPHTYRIFHKINKNLDCLHGFTHKNFGFGLVL